MISDRHRLHAVHAAWRALLARSAADTIFLTPEWTQAWLDAYGDGGGLCTVAVYRGTALIGLALLARRRAALREWPLRERLCFAADGSADSDHLDILAAPGEAATVVETVMARLDALPGTWHALAWNEMPASSPVVPALTRWFDAHGWWRETQTVPCARVDLPDTWDGYLKMLKPRMRTKVRGLVNTADAEPDLVFDRCTAHADLPARLASLYALHQARWALRGRDGIFTDPAKRDFYERMSRAFLANGWLRFYSLRWRDQYIAHQFCFERNGILSLLQEGFDTDWSDKGVGNTLRALVFRDCIARGVAVYDFLAGVTPHKLSWGAHETHNLRLLAAPPTWRCRAYTGARAGVRWSRRQAEALRHRAGARAARNRPT